MSEWRRYNPIGVEEKQAVARVMDSGCLSQFIGAWHEDFGGGREVKAFEQELAAYFGTPEAIVFNSLTSGLIAAMGAIGIQPGDEVIVSPWTMSATATAILIWGGIPVFADIRTDDYAIDPEQVLKKISSRTKAIVVTHIFGYPAPMEALTQIARDHQLRVIEDCAQAPGIKLKNRFLGDWGDIGGFSLNYHKHIHTGEGGFCLCRDPDLALKMRLIRNHAESAMVGSPISDPTNMVGFNFRMGELEAAIGREQLKKLPDLLIRNQVKVETLLSALADETWLTSTEVASVSDHAYYVLPFLLLDERISNRELADALKERGVPGVMCGYVNVHRLPMYQQKTAFGAYPWCVSDNAFDYRIGSLPVAERMHESRFLGLLISMFDLDEQECRWIAEQFKEAYQTLKAQ
ncbi:MAG: DegT/DnrJ/EryC1/StrS family aminotransferase [Saccharospirillum sp.]